MSKVTHNWVLASLDQADNERSKLTERERELHGLSSIRLKCLINNICASGAINYLEIGVYKGSTLISAMTGNRVKAYGIDNFKYDDREPNKWAPEGYIWDNMKSQLESNIDRYRFAPGVVNGDDITMIQGDFQKVDWTGKPKMDVCFFDVTPVDGASYDEFFEHIFPALSQEAVLIFSQQSNGLHAKQLNDSMLKHNDKFESLWSETRISGSNSDATKYYSGVRIFGIKKKPIAAKAISKPTANTQVKNG